MFSEEKDFETHSRNCKTLERVERFGEDDVNKCVKIMDIISEDRYKDIPMNTWPNLIKHGAAAIKKHQIRSEAENETDEEEDVARAPFQLSTPWPGSL